jgi:predicted acyltransferase
MIGCSVRNGSSEQSQTDVSARIFVISAGLLLVGLALSIIIPLNKPLWSVSYVFYTAGWASFVLALLIYLIDYKGWEKPFFPFKALGMNALALFVLSGLLMKINWRYIDWDYTAVFGSTEFLSLVFALLYMLLHLVIAVIMYRKKIFIKL